MSNFNFSQNFKGLGIARFLLDEGENVAKPKQSFCYFYVWVQKEQPRLKQIQGGFKLGRSPLKRDGIQGFALYI